VRFRVLSLPLLLTLVLSASAALAGPPALAPPGLTITIKPAAAAGVRQGSVARVDIRSAKPLARLEATVLDRPITFILDTGGRAASGLVGVAADARPGTHAITIHAETTTGERLDVTRDLLVAKAQFRSQTLRVDPRFVQPPADALPRIDKERARIAAIAHAVDRERPWQAPFGKPLATVVTEPYGVRRTFNGELASQHRGVDLKGAMGAEIAAPGAGRVVLADNLYYTGNTVIIDHGCGVQSLLAHMSRIDVKEGQIVERGEIVGEVGATGRVTGPHLHWSAWVGGVSIDPLALIAAIGR
jgi:murein DD-endopeptidase MepM/ murein hydrolase activator NlpD